MKKKIVIILSLLVTCAESGEAQVTEIISLVKTAVAKVIQAIDLEVQKLQTQTIWLQNTQKTLENTMTELKLNDIADWVQRQKDLYAEYYNELWQVKKVIADYDRLSTLIRKQSELVAAYRQAFGLFRQDKNFSSEEIGYVSGVYSGILSQSLENLDKVLLAANSFVTQMTDADRMKIIDQAAASMQKNYDDLKEFNNENIQLSVKRSIERNDVETVRRLYGLP